MATLTDQQLAFLRSQNIPMSAVFDASGMKKADYRSAMEVEGKSFAYGVTPCNAAGHTLRTRAGHCIQCDHAKIAYMLRHDAWAFIYIAGSVGGRLIKVGSTTDIDRRKIQLNKYEYGGQNDWQILAIANSPAAGRVECTVHAKLAVFSIAGHYYRAGKQQKCYELFRCNFSDASAALRAVLDNKVALRIPDDERTANVFRFRA